jgi:hypothetical protein
MSAPIYTNGAELARAFVERADAHDTTIFSTMGAPDATHQLLPKSMKSERRKFTDVVTSFAPVLELIPDFHVSKISHREMFVPPLMSYRTDHNSGHC